MDRLSHRVRFLLVSVSLLSTTLKTPASASPGEGANEVIVALVNGSPVTESEMRYWIDRTRSRVHGMFYRRFGVEDGPDYWDANTEFGGMSPLAIVKDLAMKALVRARVEFSLAHERGVIPEISFFSLTRAHAEANAQRRFALQNNEIVYGPGEFDLHGYHDHFLSTVALLLQQSFADGESKSRPMVDKDYQNIIDHRVRNAKIVFLDAYETITLER